MQIKNRFPKFYKSPELTILKRTCDVPTLVSQREQDKFLIKRRIKQKPLAWKARTLFNKSF